MCKYFIVFYFISYFSLQNSDVFLFLFCYYFTLFWFMHRGKSENALLKRSWPSNIAYICYLFVYLRRFHRCFLSNGWHRGDQQKDNSDPSDSPWECDGAAELQAAVCWWRRWDEADWAHGRKELLVSAPPTSAVFIKALCASLIRSDVTVQKEGLSSLCNPSKLCLEGQTEPIRARTRRHRGDVHYGSRSRASPPLTCR